MLRRVRLVVALSVAVSACSALQLPSSRPGSSDSFVPPKQSGRRSGPELGLTPDEQALGHFFKGEVAQQNGDIEVAAAEFEKALQLDPTAPNLHEKLANLYVQQGKVQRAYEEAVAASSAAPDSMSARMLVAGTSAALGRDAEAADAYSDIIARDPRVQEAYLFLAALYSKRGDTKSAQTTLERLINTNPNSVMGYFYAARLQAGAGRLDEAERLLQEALKRSPRSELLLTDLGLVEELRQRPEKALDHYRRVLELDPEHKVARARSGALLVGQKRLDEALTEYQELEKIETDPTETRVKIGLIYLEKGDYERAASEFNLALGANPSNTRVHYYLGAVYLETKQLERAEEEFRRVADNVDLYPDARLQLGTLAQRRGDIAGAIDNVNAALAKRPAVASLIELLVSLERERKNYPGALVHAKQLVEREPNNDRFRFTLGALLDEMKDRDGALVEMRHAIEANPQNAAALNYLGYSLVENGRDLDEAERLIRRALQIDPSDGFYIDSLGWLYFARGDFPKAVQELERAVEITGDDPTINEHLADAYVKVGKELDALRVYQEALKKTKDDDQGKRLRSKIQSLERANRAGERRI